MPVVINKEVATTVGTRKIEAKIEQAKLELQKEILTIKNDLLKWQISVRITSTIGALGGMFTMLKLMLHV